MADGPSLAMEGQVGGQGEKLPIGQEEPAADHPASPVHVALKSHDHQMAPPLPPADGGAPRTSFSQIGHGDAELAESQREVEVALKSPSILPDHRAILGTALNQFWFAEAGMMEVFLGLSKGFKERFSFSIHMAQAFSNLYAYTVALKDDGKALSEIVI